MRVSPQVGAALGGTESTAPPPYPVRLAQRVFRSESLLLRISTGSPPCRPAHSGDRIPHRCGNARACWHGARTLPRRRSEEHTSELQSLMRISYAVFCLQKQTYTQITN